MGAADKLYNGNIAETFWRTATDGGYVRNYGYKYDSLNRLKDATYQKSNSVTHNYDENLTYDKNGNIVTLLRYTHNSDGQIGAMKMDELTYEYKSPTSNQLMKVTENLSGNVSQGFIDGNTTGDDYVYDANGNMTVDNNKHITSITYNHLNLPTQITFGTTGNIVYIYTASGQKVKKVVTSTTPASVVTTDYLGGYQYSNSSLQFFPTVEGYVNNTPVSGTNTYSYVFNYTDHLGNVRLSYTKNPSTNALTILEESNYYPFGLKHNGYNPISPAQEYKYKYNGKELQDELGLNMYDYGARNYDPALGRWMNVDPLAEKMRRYSPYNYAFDNPIRFIDPDGMAPDDWITWKTSDGQQHVTYDAEIKTKKQAEAKGYSNVAVVCETCVGKSESTGEVINFEKDGTFSVNGGEKMDVDDTSYTTKGGTLISENKGTLDAIGDFLPGALQIGGDRITKGAGVAALTGAEPIAAFLGTIGGILSTLGATGEVINNTAEGFSSGDFKLGKTLRTIGFEVLSKKLNTSGNDFGQTGEIWNDILINETNNQIDKLK